MTAKKKTTKKTAKKKASKKNTQSIDMYGSYGKAKEPTMGDLSKMAMDGAVLSGSLGLMTGVGGMMSAAFKK